MAAVKIPLQLPNKSNRYQIRFNQKFWGRIEKIAAKFRKETYGRGSTPYWIGPDQAAIRAEAAIAMFFRIGEHREWLNKESLSLKVTLFGQRIDIDGLKCLLDGLQKSGRIKNDNQIRRLTVEHIELGRGKEPVVEVEVEPL